MKNPSCQRAGSWTRRVWLNLHVSVDPGPLVLDQRPSLSSSLTHEDRRKVWLFSSLSVPRSSLRSWVGWSEITSRWQTSNLVLWSQFAHLQVFMELRVWWSLLGPGPTQCWLTPACSCHWRYSDFSSCVSSVYCVNVALFLIFLFFYWYIFIFYTVKHLAHSRPFLL